MKLVYDGFLTGELKPVCWEQRNHQPGLRAYSAVLPQHQQLLLSALEKPQHQHSLLSAMKKPDINLVFSIMKSTEDLKLTFFIINSKEALKVLSQDTEMSVR
jgi:hypothetical protein